jgi:hypothetical protein
MERRRVRMLLVLAALCLSSGGCTTKDNRGPIRVENYTETIRVGCVGDSITYGATIKNRNTDCYPAQLGRVLGSTWETRTYNS